MLKILLTVFFYATIKLRMAYAVKTPYETKTNFAMGTIASSLMDTYRRIVAIYKLYSEPTNFKNTRHTIEDVMHGYSAIQGHYNELITESQLYYKVLQAHKKKDAETYKKAKAFAKKYKLSVDAVMKLKKQGVKLTDLGFPEDLPERRNLRNLLPRDPIAKNTNIWSNLRKKNNSQEEEYKKSLRYKMWADNWKGYDGKIEGVYIADTIARLGLTNDSDFLMKELKGDV